MDNLVLIENKILSPENLQPLLHIWRFKEQKIVFTNGCFDLLHLGHIDYLAKAANLGNKLVIGLNSDKSTSDLKGPGRPITNQKSRARLLAALYFVDAVVLFDE
ncbi:MAG: adenylyltransferase/cytidyltransferase family protein, partial [Pyrinomonadaceae bacterium]|nr:adenylyltransferase/cytidyltransferase family protein [Sphingobacteriaceae bacterium]